jgi:YD repeat-containing protein
VLRIVTGTVADNTGANSHLPRRQLPTRAAVPLSVKQPLENRVWYNYLTSITGPVTGATTSFTYDGYGRLRTTRDADSYPTTTDYDALDRPTRVTYPDSTYEETTYDRLDAVQRRDRRGRLTPISKARTARLRGSGAGRRGPRERPSRGPGRSPG